MTLVLQPLRSDQTLDAGSFGIGLFAFRFGLHFAADDKLADLFDTTSQQSPSYNAGTMSVERLTSSSLVKPKNRRILVARLGPNRFG